MPDARVDLLRQTSKKCTSQEAPSMGKQNSIGIDESRKSRTQHAIKNTASVKSRIHLSADFVIAARAILGNVIPHTEK